MLVPRQASASTLVFNTDASSATGISAPSITDTDPSNLPPPSTTTSFVDSPTSTPAPPSPDATQQPPNSATSADPRQTINLGTVVGACLAAFAVLIFVITVVVWHTRRTRRALLRAKSDKWNKLSDNPRDSRRSSFESKPSLPHPSLDYTSAYPPPSLPTHSINSQTELTRFTLPAHPYASSRSALPDTQQPTNNPFADPHPSKEPESDASSLYSNASNPFQSVYTPPPATPSRANPAEGYSGSPFFTPHPDSSVQGEKWGSVGKERNVQESYASSSNAADKLGSLIAALDLDSSSTGSDGKANMSLHGHLGKFTDE